MHKPVNSIHKNTHKKAFTHNFYSIKFNTLLKHVFNTRARSSAELSMLSHIHKSLIVCYLM